MLLCLMIFRNKLYTDRKVRDELPHCNKNVSLNGNMIEWMEPAGSCAFEHGNMSYWAELDLNSLC